MPAAACWLSVTDAAAVPDDVVAVLCVQPATRITETRSADPISIMSMLFFMGSVTLDVPGMPGSVAVSLRDGPFPGKPRGLFAPVVPLPPVGLFPHRREQSLSSLPRGILYSLHGPGDILPGRGIN